MKPYLFIGSVFWLAVGTYTAVNAIRLGIGNLSHPGPGLIFLLASSVLIISSTIDLISCVIRVRVGLTSDPSIWRGRRWQIVLIVMATLSCYTLVFQVVGFTLSTFLLMVFLFRLVEPIKWGKAVISSLVATLLAYVIFRIWLGVPFPGGFLGV